MSTSLISHVCGKIRWQVEESRNEDKGLQEWRIRNVLLKPFHLSTCYTFPSPADFLRQYRIQCAPLHAECGVITFYQLLSKAFPERPLISQWSGCKTGLVSDIEALPCYSYFLTQYPGRWCCVKKVVSLFSTGFRAAQPSLPPHVQTPFSASTANSAVSFLNRTLHSQTVGMQLQECN